MERKPEVTSEIPALYFLDTGLPVKYPVWTGLKEELRTEENLFTAVQERKSGPVDVYVDAYRRARQKIKPREYFHHVGQRINPEGWTTATATDITSFFVLPGAQALIALNLNMGLDMTAPKLAVAAALTGISLMADWYALRKKGWDISIVGCVAQAITGKPALSAMLEHTINYMGPFNVVNIGAITAGIATGNFSFLIDNITAAPFVLAPWYIVMNTLIGHGQADKVLNPIGKAEDAIAGNIKHAIKG
ncbi:MAG: hypothetical protein ABSE17_02325 [Candidatus Levyibacteriota bacterium]